MFKTLKKIIFCKTLKLQNTVDLGTKLERYFIEFVQQNMTMGRDHLAYSHNPLTDQIVIEDISLLYNSVPIAWIQRIEINNGEDVLRVKHFAMDTAYTKHGYAEFVLKGFSRTIKKQFSNINYIDFLELRSDISPVKIQRYINFFKKQKMVLHSKDIYRYTI